MLGRTVAKPNGAPAVAPVLLRPAPARRGRLLFGLLGLAVLAAVVAVSLFLLRSKAEVSYVTVAQTRGDFAQTVTASGTVNAQNTISVGTQVSGTIQTLYVDFNSRVRTGEILAQLDPTQFRAQLHQAQASLAQARAQAAASAQSTNGANYSVQAAHAQIVSANEGVIKAQAALTFAKQTLARDSALLANGYIGRSTYDADYANEVAAATALRSARAAVSQNAAQALQATAGAAGSASTQQGAAAAVQAQQAIVEQDQFNLDRSTITSPVDGTIVARNVSVGQTVAASFQTPTLFTIAQDLKKMEVDIAVGEPDIGNVRPGQPVSFAVLAYPNRTFHGVVSQVRVNPTTISNVVTYTVVVLVKNTDNALLPGMTANATIRIAQVKNALIVPLQALGYRPAGKTGTSTRAARAVGTSPWGATANGVAGAVVAGSNRSIFVLRNGTIRRVPVHVNLVNGMQAAVTPQQPLKSGDTIVVSDSSSQQPRTQPSTNPAFGLGRAIR